MQLIGAYAVAAVVALGAAVFGAGVALECAAVGIFEECLFTGALFAVLCRQCPGARGSVAKPALLCALIFGICHLRQPWKAPLAFAFSLCMIALYRRTGSLAWPICAHTAFDMLWFGLFALP